MKKMKMKKMINQWNKVLKFTVVILFFVLSKSYAIEDVSELTDAVNEAREEFNNVSEATSEQSKIIDEAIKEIDKATEYVQEAINNDSAEDAIKTLEFIEKSLTDVESIIPQEFSSDMTNIDTSAISKEDMDLITDMTTQMNVAKEEKDNEFMSDLMDLNLKGIDTVSISENLNGLGVKTIELVLDVEGAENLEKWTKGQWAESYTGDILTTVGDETITDKEIGNKVVDLEQQLQTNNAAILDKRDSLTELQTKIDPLSNEITNLQTQKTNLLAKYNEEVLKQSSTVLSDEEIGQSKELANQLNNQVSEITSDIEVVETQSNVLQQQVQDINTELTNQIAVKTQLENNIRDLNNQLSVNRNILSQKTSELDRLKNTDLNRKAKDLNDNLERATLQRDFVQRDFDKSIDKEVDAFTRYYSALGEVDADNYDVQAEYAVREVQAILNPDPKQYRAFEYEKYAKLAGVSQSVLDEGLTAIANDDWDTQKKVTKEILRALEKNPQAVLPKDWYFGKSTDGDINIMIAEDKAIQEAVYTSIELNNIKDEVSSSIVEKTKKLEPFLNINTNNVKNYSTSQLQQLELYQNEFNKVLESDIGKKVNSLANEINEKNNEFNNLIELDQQRRETIKKEIDKLNDKINKDAQEWANINTLVNENNQAWAAIDSQNVDLSPKFYAGLQNNKTIHNLRVYGFDSDWQVNKTLGKTSEFFNSRTPDVQKKYLDNLEKAETGDRSIWSDNLKELNETISNNNTEMQKINKEIENQKSQIQKIKETIASENTKIENIKLDNLTAGDIELNKIDDLRKQVETATIEKYSLEKEIVEVSKQNLLNTIESAKTDYNQIVAEETEVITKYQNKISNILKEIPTFENNADSLVNMDPVRLRAKLVDLASDGSFNESAAVNAALKELGQIGDKPVSEFMTGPLWEASNIKTAAIVRSKKYSYVSDYAYTSAYGGDPLSLNAADREVLEGELKDVLGGSNPVLDALNEKVESLSTEVNLTKEQSQNITTEMAKLENELSSLKNSEGELQKQINDFTNQFNSKESLIAEKNQNLASIQEQLNPISEKMNELQGQRTELDGKLNDQLNTIADQVKDQGQVSDEANALKAEFESQIAELDNQIKEFENQSNEINSQLTTITTELSVLETENPELANQIASLNQDLESFKDLKADLAMATAKKLGINVDDASLKSVKVIDGKVVVALEGSNLVSVVDKEMLVENASEFIDPTTELSINTKVYAAGALNRELVTPEFVEAAKSISTSAKIDVIAQASAVQAAGATTEQSAKYASAKATRLAARKDWDAAMASGDKAAADAAEAAFMAARDVEQIAGQEAVAAAAAASSAAQAAATQVASVAQEASEAASQAAAEVQDAVASAQSAQQAALEALQELESLPGATGFHSQEVQAAIEQLQAEMQGRDYSYMGYSSYEEAMAEIERMEKTGKSAVQCMSDKNGGQGAGC
jgi:septal ring factor EnvC (AmiA/AmiB activator)